MDPAKLLNMFTLFFLSVDLNNSSFFLILNLLYLFGMWGIFKKCGLTPWHALIPCLREDKLGEAAGLEKEGRIAAMLHGISILISEVNLLFGSGSLANMNSFLSIAGLFISLVQFIYLAKLYLGLCEVFDQKKRWIILWLFLDGIPAVLWGWRKKYQPLWTATELKNEAASYFSGTKAAVLDLLLLRYEGGCARPGPDRQPRGADRHGIL